MPKILLLGTEISYAVRQSPRARLVRIDINRSGEVIITVPRRLPEIAGEKFLRQKSRWLLRHLKEISQLVPPKSPSLTRHDYLKHKAAARRLILERLEFFNQFYQFSWRGVSVRDQKTLWGSCSPRGRLNFNYRLLFLPAALRDYIIVHELCHLKELNHSKRFWALVFQTFPNFKSLRRELKNHEYQLF